ncbi:MFS transporter, FHS family, L-fucose permease [Sphingobacterium nematocida]|uniref:MFS transporter, FHS family, L-fucose permease n=1 Tax=Sphingobacterium nematocida TaxID=1513896 RepID=A0A1T5CHX3_9SPHI|nr:L-fucose:H+ symporter permease [Sphingobacterium nematocida]SKB59082.1 MFS transporter, FHS family, L-fucose permease [Sphingobacterium nematocida]
MTQVKKYTFAIILITSLFFFWGFIHNLDPILIKHLRSAFSLTHFQASLVDSAVFIAYFFLAIPAGMIMKRYGYKSGILVGLSLFALGCFLFIPAANTISYPFFLGALFVLSCGLTILETAANPYITVLGEPAKATQRLNFAQSFNGLAASVAPIVGGVFILAEEPKSAAELASMTEQAKTAYIQAETSLVKGPYLILGLLILFVAVLFFLTKLPEIKEEEGESSKGFLGALRHKNVRWGVLAQFFYVGAQIYVFSFLLVFAEDALGMSGQDGKYYAGLAGFLFMIGRFIGTFFMRYVKPYKLLIIYSVIAILLCLVVIYGTGLVTLYALVGITFFMSIMFPTIFALGIEGTGADTKSASSLIIMSIVGGAVIPPLASKVTDITGNIHLSYYITLLCFIVVLFFAWNNKGKEAISGTQE